MHISYALHSLDYNLADGEYVLIPEQGPVQEEDQEQASEAAIVLGKLGQTLSKVSGRFTFGVPLNSF
jgi:hypothetical protein